MDSSVALSVVVPCFNEQDVLPTTHGRILSVLCALNLSYEILYVDDGSCDDTSAIIGELCRQNGSVKCIQFAANAGHQAAIWAGMQYSCGDLVVILDADLQDPPEVIAHLMKAMADTGCDVVYARRTMRKGESIAKKATAFIFYRTLNWFSDRPIPKDAGDFRIMRRIVVNAIVSQNNHHGYLRGITSWLGFNHAAVDYVRESRYAGQSKYTWQKMFQLALTGIIEFGSLSRILVVQMLMTMIGLVICGVWLQMSTVNTTKALLAVLVYGTFVFAMWTTIGLLYIRRIFDLLRGHPRYVIRSLTNIQKAKNGL